MAVLSESKGISDDQRNSENHFPIIFLVFLSCFLNSSTLAICTFRTCAFAEFAACCAVCGRNFKVECVKLTKITKFPNERAILPFLTLKTLLSVSPYMPMQKPSVFVSAHPPPCAETSRVYCAMAESVIDKKVSIIFLIILIMSNQSPSTTSDGFEKFEHYTINLHTHEPGKWV